MPKAKSKGATFELFEMFTNRREFHWFVKDADGNVIDAWNDELGYDDEAERQVGSKAFGNPDDALAYFAEHHPDAVDLHQYAKGG